MKKLLLFLVIILICYSSSFADSTTFVNPHKFATEVLVGLRIPMGITRDDILSGLGFSFGIGYQLTRNWEIFHLAFDFGSSTPHDPEWVTVYDPYDYYTRLQQETVNIYGFPATIRYRFQLHEQLEGYVGAGVAYYWFRTRLADPYWGELKKPRRRHGGGGIFVAGIFTDAFGDDLLVGLTANLLYLRTTGKTLTTPKFDEVDGADKIVTRDDLYLTIGISLRYYLGNE